MKVRSSAMARIVAKRMAANNGATPAQASGDKKEQKKSAKNHAPMAARSAAARKSGGM